MTASRSLRREIQGGSGSSLHAAQLRNAPDGRTRCARTPAGDCDHVRRTRVGSRRRTGWPVFRPDQLHSPKSKVGPGRIAGAVRAARYVDAHAERVAFYGKEADLGATLCIGKNLRFKEPADGSHRLELTGSPCEGTNIAHSSVAQVEELAWKALGIAPESWPFYHDIEVEWELPLDEVIAKCAALREFFSRYDEKDLPDDHWLREFARLLREGWDFCTFV